MERSWLAVRNVNYPSLHAEGESQTAGSWEPRETQYSLRHVMCNYTKSQSHKQAQDRRRETNSSA